MIVPLLIFVLCRLEPSRHWRDQRSRQQQVPDAIRYSILTATVRGRIYKTHRSGLITTDISSAWILEMLIEIFYPMVEVALQRMQIAMQFVLDIAPDGILFFGQFLFKRA